MFVNNSIETFYINLLIQKSFISLDESLAPLPVPEAAVEMVVGCPLDTCILLQISSPLTFHLYLLSNSYGLWDRFSD